MDLIELRRMVMAQMSATIQGANYAKGTFTTGTGSTHTLSFGKTYSKYLYYIEMTDASKTALLSSSQTSARMYACCGVYPAPSVSNSTPSNNSFVSYRITPSDSSLSVSNSNVSAIDSSSITFTNNTFSNGQNNLYREQTYNYYIVEIK